MKIPVQSFQGKKLNIEKILSVGFFGNLSPSSFQNNKETQNNILKSSIAWKRSSIETLLKTCNQQFVRKLILKIDKTHHQP